MYKLAHRINQNDRCNAVALDNSDNFICYSSENYLNLFNKTEFMGLGEDAMSQYQIKCNDSVISAKFNPDGDSKYIYIYHLELGISDLDYRISVYDVYSNFKQICSLYPGTCIKYVNMV